MPFLVALVLILVLIAVLMGSAFRRVGWSPWLALPMLVPGVNLAGLAIFSLYRWPLEARVRQLEAELRSLRGEG